MRIALFLGALDPHGVKLKADFEAKKYRCIITNNPDEVSQVSLQAERVGLIFTDYKFAYKFVQENRFPASACFNAIYLLKQPVVTKEISNKLSHANLKVYCVMNKDKLIQDISDFIDNKNNTSTDEMDIEFSIIQAIKKET
jgi:hypothetical protein